ncbi:MAG: catechol 2,3-dioxygenase-like lactoylglutathione lyase family enzyme [Ilumatobacter sp.]|jgi:catechol 2,3-dioxygenase-like lactoylglutathione lyase family enzyme
MVNYQDLFHVGIRVPDLAVAMDELGASMNLIWAEVRENPAQTLWTPQNGLEEIHLKFVYSAEGPQHIELLEGAPGSFWDGTECTGTHHVGVWVDDVAAQTNALIESGWTLVGSQHEPSPSEGFGAFTYVKPPTGLIVELVNRDVLAHFEQWWGAAL